MIISQVIGQEFKATDIEVGIVTVKDPKFRKLTVAEIETHLSSIQKFD